VSDVILKYPRTPHLEGSRLQPGDDDMRAVRISDLEGRFIVVTEKLDGANSGISFDQNGTLRLQSRGHFLDGGPRERQFALFKAWASAHEPALRALLKDQYVLYGEWLYAKHTIFYDALTHYFQEFDILDKQSGEFLSTGRRQALLAGGPIVSAPILFQGRAPSSLARLSSLVGRSAYKTANWREHLRQQAALRGQDAELVERQTDESDSAEGLYIKVEDGGRVVDRCKLIRASFLQTVEEAGDHWMERPILPNTLREGCGLFPT
jgi:hypothetical protein